MNFKIITAYPWWFILICLLFGLLVTALLYFWQRRNDFSASVTWTLAILRFISASLLSFLLLSPMFRNIKRTTVKPSVVIGIDNSSSIVMNKDSAYYKSEFLEKIKDLQDELDDEYEVELYNFGNQVEKDAMPGFKDELTDISSLFKEVNTRYFNRNIGAVIVASDGIFNAGTDPLYQVRNSKYPVFTINLGDTTSRKDLKIQQVIHNKTAIKGNRFPIEITIHAVKIPGERSVVSIYEGTERLFSQEVGFTTNNQIITVPAFLEAKDAGMKRLRISVEEIKDEINTANNSREIFIEVKESKLKVAIITESPHPDVAALERVFENSNNFEAEVFKVQEFNKTPEEYSLIIFNQLPSITYSNSAQLNNILKSKTPLLLIIGAQSNIQLLNSLNLGLTMTNFKGSWNEALPSLNTGFSLFLYSDAQKKLIESLPPLLSPFASYSVSNSMKVFTRQIIGRTATEMPLIMFNETVDRRLAIISGEGIWKWRIFDYVQNNTHSNFDDLIGKMFLYLTAQTEKGRFRVDWNNFYAENENIQFNAILLNESYEPVTEPEVSIEITDEQKHKFDYAFSAEEEKYSLKVGNYNPGVYTFEARANAPDQIFTKKGSFVVTDVKLEDVNLVANHRLLRTIAAESGGKSFMPNDLEGIAESIRLNENVKPVIYSRKNYTDLIDYYPLMILIFVLLGIEWFLRKFMGSY